MKYKIHRIANQHITCDITDDSGNLIIGNHMVMIDKIPDDMEQFFETVIYPQIEESLKPVAQPETVQLEASPILQEIELSKESLKFKLLQYIKDNPSISMTAFFTYCDSVYDWGDSGLIANMLKQYVNYAVKKGLIQPLKDITRATYFNTLKGIILNTDIETLKEMLK